MNILSKLGPEKNPYFSKPKTDGTNRSDNSSCSQTGSEFLLTNSHSSNSSNDTTGIPMNKVNNAPRRVKNIPVSLTPNIRVDKFDFPAATPTNDKPSLRDAGKRSPDGKPPRPPAKEPTYVPNIQRHPYAYQAQNDHEVLQAYNQSTSNNQYRRSQIDARPEKGSHASPDELPIMRHQQSAMENYLPLSSEQMRVERVPRNNAETPRRQTQPSIQTQVQEHMPPVQRQMLSAEVPSQSEHIHSFHQGQESYQQYVNQQNQHETEEQSESDSEEYTDDTSGSESGEYTDTSQDSVNVRNATTSSSSSINMNTSQQHPYHEQWVQYYASLAAQQQQQQQQQQQMRSNRNSMYGGAFPNQVNSQAYSDISMAQPQIAPTMQEHISYSSYAPNYSAHRLSSGSSLASESHKTKNDFLAHCKRRHGSISDTDSELISNSRRSTIMSNRYPSVPLSILETESKAPENVKETRVSSLDLNFKPKKNLNCNAVNYENDQEEKISPRDNRSVHSEKQNQDTTKSIAFGLLNLAIDNKPGQRYISDYGKFLFDSDSENEEEENEEEENEEGENEEGENEESFDNSSNHSHISVRDKKLLPQPPQFNELSRNLSIESTKSADSIQSEAPSNFKVKSRTLTKNFQPAAQENYDQVAVQETNNKEKARKRKDTRKERHVRQSSSFNPNLSISSQSEVLNSNPCTEAPPRQPGMMPYIAQPQIPPVETMGIQNSMPYNHPMMTYSTEYQGVVPSMAHSRRQSIATAESKRQSMMFATGNSMGPYGIQPMNNNRMSMPVMGLNVPNKPELRTKDSKIKKKVEDFVELRQVIASGNKSLEYRLEWIKMLISATNYRLYAFVNIKGEPVAQECSQQNKALFIKSSINHLLKLIKEYEVRKKDDIIHSQVFYIYGCLLKQDYATPYNQDFGIEKDIPLAISHFEKSLELNPNNFKSLYKLGEVFEYEFPDQFEEALIKYKEAAKLGYSRAIYQMALLYLNVPLIRSTKFFNYFVELSNIDLNSKDVELTGEDRDELGEIMGLACFQLGKIYEGIYPGDLHAEDEFVSRSLERVPVNYTKGLAYYNKSAKLDCLLAQIKLGSVYENGDLNRQTNPSKSIQWYMKATSSPLLFKRHPNAMLGLSRWNLLGSDGLSKYIPSPNPEKAVMLCDRAIKEFGLPDAYFAMGQLTEIGLGDRNPQIWYSSAYELGHPEASSKFDYA